MTPRRKSVICGLGEERKKYIYWYNYRKTSWDDSWGVNGPSRRIPRYLVSTQAASGKPPKPEWEKSNFKGLECWASYLCCGLADKVMFGHRLDSMTSKVFSNLIYSVTLWFCGSVGYCSCSVSQGIWKTCPGWGWSWWGCSQESSAVSPAWGWASSHLPPFLGDSSYAQPGCGTRPCQWKLH